MVPVVVSLDGGLGDTKDQLLNLTQDDQDDTADNNLDPGHAVDRLQAQDRVQARDVDTHNHEHETESDAGKHPAVADRVDAKDRRAHGT